MEPIKVRLEHGEVNQILQYCIGAAGIAVLPEASLELIVLAEFREKIATQLMRNRQRNRNKVFQYTLPVSVARILHRRWQEIPYNRERQMVLNALDHELTNRELKPDLSKPTIV
ncbi:hypothetical protein [Salmonirosea aquatica]|uniref:Uncharacterized protein n=1 Tax=Salmonirosea aquatica TaxID=2654236 RepID=A0A7C9F8K1_9BACT|nr:hypothetical protein [Cytophagaceae bacterium SJW1-29]